MHIFSGAHAIVENEIDGQGIYLLGVLNLLIIFSGVLRKQNLVSVKIPDPLGVRGFRKSSR